MKNPKKVVKNRVILNRGLYRWAAPRSVFVRGLINDRIQDLRRLSLQLVNNLRGRFQIKFGMTPCVKGFTPCRHPELGSGSSRIPHQGFTLLEVLVVVLIIGILAAVAVPQYQKAVLKSRFASLLPLGKSLHASNEAYYMEHGNYSDSLGNLDVTTNDNNVQVTMGNEDQHQYVLLTRDDIKNNLRMYQKHSPNFAGETHCEALQDNTQANWLCKDSLHGQFVGNKYGYAVYSLSPETVGTLARNYYNGAGHTGVYNGDNCVDLKGNGGCPASQYENGAVCDASTVWGYGCYSSQFSDHAMCYGASTSCTGARTSFTNYSVCVALGPNNACKATYSNHSSCVGNGTWNPHAGGSCRSSSFSDHSACFGLRSDTYNRGASDSCGGNNFSDNSYCVGSAKNTCQGSDFKMGSICYANASGACAGSTYDNTSCCAGGENCENVADRCETKNITVPTQPTVPDY